jgi:hypothetical protein
MTSDAQLAPSWTYSMADYCQMFDLNDSDLDSRILDYPAGISSFNAEMHAEGCEIISGDLLYQMTLPEITAYADRVYQANVEHLDQQKAMLQGDVDQVFDKISTDWKTSQQKFLQDYDAGKQENRYQLMQIDEIPFEEHEMDIALCSDHLFHHRHCNHDDQAVVIKALCHAAKEVRVFPLLDEKGKIADNLGGMMLMLQEQQYGVEVREVPYHQMKGGNAMLRIWATSCVVET